MAVSSAVARLGCRILRVTRYCGACRQRLPLREFDLGDGQAQATCRSCAHRRSDTAHRNREQQIAALERERRSLIAALVKIDAEIIELRGRSNEQIVVLERQRRSLIAALVKIDAKIAELLGRPPPATFELVEPEDVFGVDNDLGFGD